MQSFERYIGGRFLRLIKPSTRLEGWLGFDIGFVCTPLSEKELVTQLTQAIRSAGSGKRLLYVGFFLQYKVVQRVKRRGRYTPPGYGTPYLRVRLDLSPNRSSRLSQHECLIRLSAIGHSHVYYACPMVFDPAQTLLPPQPSQLRLVDVSSAPRDWGPREWHFITFQRPDDPHPFWFSEPSPAATTEYEEWVPRVARSAMSGDEVVEFIRRTRKALELEALFPEFTPLPHSMTIAEFEVGGTHE